MLEFFKVVGGGVSEAFVPETPHTFITFSFADAVVNEVVVVVTAATIFWLHFQFSSIDNQQLYSKSCNIRGL